MKKILLYLIGFACVILGTALIFKDWVAVVIVFKGVFGALLAIGGLVMLTVARN